MTIAAIPTICPGCGQSNPEGVISCVGCGSSLLPSNPKAPLFIGRHRVLDSLRSGLNAAFSGHGSLVLLVGEAGIGKTWIAVDRHAGEYQALTC